MISFGRIFGTSPPSLIKQGGAAREQKGPLEATPQQSFTNDPNKSRVETFSPLERRDANNSREVLVCSSSGSPSRASGVNTSLFPSEEEEKAYSCSRAESIIRMWSRYRLSILTRARGASGIIPRIYMQPGNSQLAATAAAAFSSWIFTTRKICGLSVNCPVRSCARL